MLCPLEPHQTRHRHLQMNAVSTDVVDTRVSGLTRYSGDPADTGLLAVHAAAFDVPDLLNTQKNQTT